MFVNPVPTLEWRPTLDQQAVDPLVDALDSWVSAPALSILANAWGEVRPAAYSPGELFAWYDEISGRHWDYRHGVERNQSRPAALPSQQADLAIEVAHSLGMIDGRAPCYSEYDFALILGGLVRACLVRPRYAANLASHRTVFGDVFAIGSLRPLAGDEVKYAQALSTRAKNEFDALLDGVTRAFALSASPEVENSPPSAANAAWRVARFNGAPSIEVLAAPSAAPERRRANTRDGLAWWANRQKSVRGKRILVVTSPIYVPYQSAGAIEVLGLQHGAAVETVGVPPDLADLGPNTQHFDAQDYLQEVRSTIRGYKSLWDKLHAKGKSDE